MKTTLRPLVFANHLYGREAVAARLREAWGAAQSTRILALVSGYSGSGKTALVEQLRVEAELRGECFISGKCDQERRGTPYLPIAEALTQFARHFSTLPLAIQAVRSAELRAAVGASGRVLLEFAPALSPILGDAPPVPTLQGVEARHRCARVFRNFLAAASGPAHPLILFVDDLQWIDGASLDLLRAVTCNEAEIAHGGLLVVAAYRDNEVDAGHSFFRLVEDAEAIGLPVRRITLCGLSRSDVRAIVGDLLDLGISPRPETLDLADALHDRTAGNPFFLRLLLRHLQDSGKLEFRNERWEWEADAAAFLGVADNVAELLSVRLHKLPGEVQEILSVAACLGATFSVQLLADATGRPLHTLGGALTPAVSESLISVQDSTGAFIHDRVQQAALALVPAERQPKLRLGIARQLLGNRLPETINGKIFIAATQYLEAAPLLEDSEEKLKVARVHLAAGRRARETAAFLEAYHFLRAGLSLLPPDAWNAEVKLTFELHRHCQLAAVAAALHEESDGLFEVLHHHVTDPVDLIECVGFRATQLSMRGRHREALDVGLEYFGRLGFPVDLDAVDEEVEALLCEAEAYLRTPGALEHLPLRAAATDPRLIAAARLGVFLCPTAYFADMRVHNLIVLRAFVWAIRNGPCVSTPAYIARLGVVLASCRGGYADASRLGNIAIEGARRFGDPYMLGDALFIHAFFCSHWRNPLPAALAVVREADSLLHETGDLQHSLFYITLPIAIESGASLVDAQAQADDAMAEARRSRDSHFESAVRFQCRTIDALCDRTIAPDSFADLQTSETEIRNSAAGDRMALAFYFIYREFLASLSGGWEKAAHFAEEAEGQLPVVTGSLLEVVHCFHAGLARFRVAAAGCGEEAAAMMERAERHLGQMREWATLCPENFAHKAALLRAERAVVQKDFALAEAAYLEAMDGAHRHGFRADEALASELAGRFYLSQNREAESRRCLVAARKAFAEWGASAHVRRLDAEFPFLHRDEARRTDTGKELARNASWHDAGAIAPQPLPAKAPLNESMILQAFESAGHCVWDWDLISGDCTYSSGWKAMLGFADDEIAPRIEEWERLANPEDMAAAYSKILRHAQTGEQFAQEMRMRCKDGSVKWVVVRGGLVERAADGRPRRMLGTATDVTYRKDAEEAVRSTERRLLLAFDAVGDGFWDWDMVTGKVFYSTSWKELLGYADDEVGDTIDEIWRLGNPDDLRKTFQAVERHVTTGEPFASEFRIRCKDGSTKWLLGRGKLIARDADGRPLRMIGTNTDITDRKRLQEELEGLVHERTASLEAANRELASFSHSVAHDLRSPLAGIQGFSQFMEQRCADQLDENGKRYLMNIRKSAKRMAQLIEDMMMLSRVREREMWRQKVDLSAIAREVVAELREREPLRVAEISIPRELPVQADPNLLRIAMANLLGNAWKYTSRRDVARIELTAEQKDDKTVYCVRDNGAGFNMDQAPRLFAPFQRLHLESEFPGTGIGLTIVHRIIERHGGRIWAESAVDQGAAFYFTIGQK